MPHCKYWYCAMRHSIVAHILYYVCPTHPLTPAPLPLFLIMIYYTTDLGYSYYKCVIGHLFRSNRPKLLKIYYTACVWSIRSFQAAKEEEEISIVLHWCE